MEIQEEKNKKINIEMGGGKKVTVIALIIAMSLLAVILIICYCFGQASDRAKLKDQIKIEEEKAELLKNMKSVGVPKQEVQQPQLPNLDIK